jgi:hypothetical protein
MVDDQHWQHPDRHPSDQAPYPPHEFENQYYDYQQGGYGSPAQTRSQTKMGIASFVLGIAALLLAAAALVISVVMLVKHPDIEHMTPGQRPPMEILPLALSACGTTCFSVIIGIVGLILGITVLMNPDARKGFAIAGVVANGLTLVLWLLVIINGLVGRA